LDGILHSIRFRFATMLPGSGRYVKPKTAKK
jgi:hypothetical protein